MLTFFKLFLFAMIPLRLSSSSITGGVVSVLEFDFEHFANPLPAFVKSFCNQEVLYCRQMLSCLGFSALLPLTWFDSLRVVGVGWGIEHFQLKISANGSFLTDLEEELESCKLNLCDPSTSAFWLSPPSLSWNSIQEWKPHCQSTHERMHHDLQKEGLKKTHASNTSVIFMIFLLFILHIVPKHVEP